MGIDGIITDYPNRVRQIMADRGMRLPKAYKPKGYEQH
jgi:glycerophosphoryl diester phosphodiesterase